jgi:hypothetical protein
MKDFTTKKSGQPKRKSQHKGEAITFKHDGREVTFYQPNTSQLAILMMSVRQDQMDANRASAFMTLMFELMDRDTRRYFEDRMMDLEDDFEIDSEGGLMDIYIELIKEWSGRPTEQPTASPKKRSATGSSSTVRTRARASTSNASPSTASST